MFPKARRCALVNTLAEIDFTSNGVHVIGHIRFFGSQQTLSNGGEKVDVAWKGASLNNVGNATRPL